MQDHHITADPGGQPVIAGTHVTVETVLRELAASEAVDAILTAHPELDRDAVQAALEFAAAQLPVLEPATAQRPPATMEAFTPRTEFGKRMWELHQAVVEEARQRGEPLLETWEDVAREVRERRGKRDDFEERL
jgi:uncharacterized protein (DUF433 family)